MTTGQGLIAGFSVDQRRRNLTPSTVAHRTSRLFLFARWLGDVSLAEATEDDVQRFLDSRRMQARTRYHWLVTLHCFYEWAVHHGYAATDPTASIVRPKLRRLLPRPVADDDHAVALRSAPLEMEAWLRLMSYAGLRVAEVAGLSADDVLTGENRLRIIGKGDRERLVPIHPSVGGVLIRHGMPRRGPVFRRPDGRAWPPRHLSLVTCRYLDDIGVDATGHQFRHWFGTKLYIATRDLRLVQELMGHASPVTTAGYTAFASAEADGAVGDLPDV